MKTSLGIWVESRILQQEFARLVFVLLTGGFYELHSYDGLL
jgi:hypothetical protein